MNQEMRKGIEFEDKTVERAIKAACEHFGCKEDELDIEIITRGSTGLFGIGGKKAKIRVFLKQAVISEIVEGDEEKEKSEDTIADNTSISEEIETIKQDNTKNTESTVSEDNKVQEGSIIQSDEDIQATEVKPAKYHQEDFRRYLEKALDFTNELLKKAGFDSRAEIVEKGTRPFIDISGEDLSLVIGKDGQTLDSMEYILNLAMKRIVPEISYKIMLEATGYRDRRKKNLIALAQKQAQRARRTGRVVSLQPMPARERRIVHIALKDFKGVRTHSSGEGNQRKVIITPIKKRRNNIRHRNNR